MKVHIFFILSLCLLTFGGASVVVVKPQVQLDQLAIDSKVPSTASTLEVPWRTPLLRRNQALNSTLAEEELNFLVSRFTPEEAEQVRKLLEAAFVFLNVTDVNITTCVNIVGKIPDKLSVFEEQVSGKNFSDAVESLSAVISFLSSSVHECGIPEVQDKLDTLAVAFRWAEIMEASGILSILVGFTDVLEDLNIIAKAVVENDFKKVGEQIAKLSEDWKAVGACNNSKTCHFYDSLFKVLNRVAEVTDACEHSMKPVLDGLVEGFKELEKHQYGKAVKDISMQLDHLALVMTTDACKMHLIADQIRFLTPRLAKALIKVETEVHIMVGYANIYDELFQALEALQAGDDAEFGEQVGRLLQTIDASQCKTNACIVFQGMIAAIKVESTHLHMCVNNLDGIWHHVEEAFGNIMIGFLRDGLDELATVFTLLAKAVDRCGIVELADSLQQTARALDKQRIAGHIGYAIMVILDGRDVTRFMQQVVMDWKHKDWRKIGEDLGVISKIITDKTDCTTFVCELVEGALAGLGHGLANLDKCVADFKGAEQGFITGAEKMSAEDYPGAMKHWGKAMMSASKAASDCGFKEAFGNLTKEAGVFALMNVTHFADQVKFIIHAKDFSPQIREIQQAFHDLNYRKAGKTFVMVLNSTLEWTQENACTTNACYIVVGFAQFLAQGFGFQKCLGDVEEAYGNFTASFHHFHDNKTKHAFFFTNDRAAIKHGVDELGSGLIMVSKAVSDCKLVELGYLIKILAHKLKYPAQILWINAILNILINGINIEHGIGDACHAWADDDPAGFGYAIINLLRLLH